MTDYTSREAVLDRIIGYDLQHCPDYMEDQATELKHKVICDLKDAVETLPAADVAPVVRCEYCYAYRKDKELARAANLDEDQYCALLQCEMPPNGYCYYGKKKRGYTEKDSGEQSVIDYIDGSAGNRWNRLLDKLINVLLRYKFRKQPEWMGTTFTIDEMTDVHCLVETWRNGEHFFGTRGEKDAVD